jgi:hypothetical protein
MQPAQDSRPQLLTGPAAGDGRRLVPALVSALLEFSYSPQLCEQLLQAGIMPALAQLLLPEAHAGMNSKLSTQVRILGGTWLQFL